jgi:hypothetical protein
MNLKAIFVLFAFVLLLQDGREIKVPGAIGFMFTVIQKVTCMTFFDAKGETIGSVPTSLIHGAAYIPEDKVL